MFPLDNMKYNLAAFFLMTSQAVFDFVRTTKDNYF